jgi:hypothetical protein
MLRVPMNKYFHIILVPISFDTKVKLSLISHQQIQFTSKSLHRTTPLRCELQTEQENSNNTLINKKTPNRSYKQRRHPTNKLATKTT